MAEQIQDRCVLESLYSGAESAEMPPLCSAGSELVVLRVGSGVAGVAAASVLGVGSEARR